MHNTLQSNRVQDSDSSVVDYAQFRKKTRLAHTVDSSAEPKSHQVVTYDTSGTLGSIMANPYWQEAVYLPRRSASGIVHINFVPSGAESWRKTLQKLRSAIDAQIVEDGQSHPGELVLEFAIYQNKGHVLEGLFSILTNPEESKFAAQLMKLVGRLQIGGEVWRKRMLQAGLASEDAEVRDSAMQLVENWEDASLLPELSSHKDDVPWLSEYAEQIVSELKSD